MKVWVMSIRPIISKKYSRSVAIAEWGSAYWKLRLSNGEGCTIVHYNTALTYYNINLNSRKLL